MCLIKLFKKKKEEIIIETPQLNEIQLLGSSKYKEPQFDLNLIIDTLKSYQKNSELIKSDCQEWNVTLDNNWKPTIQYGKSIQVDNDQLSLQNYIHKALYYYSKGENKLQSYLDKQIPILEDWRNDYESTVEKRRKEKREELEKEGLLCPECIDRGLIEGMRRVNNGIFKIYYRKAIPSDSAPHAGGIGGNDGYSNKCDEYQYHGRRCPNCGHIIVDEYRKTPNWLEDALNIQPEFKKGSAVDCGRTYNHTPYSLWDKTEFIR